MLIKTYGEQWRRDMVNWSRGQMIGYGKNQGRKANFWLMKGVYALYRGHELMYVGQTYMQSIGQRLKQHTKDEKRDRWETFSWYGIQDVVRGKDSRGIHRLGAVNRAEKETMDQIVESFESLAIRIIDPPLNRKRGKFGRRKRAERFHQLAPKTKPDEALIKTLKEMKKTLDRHSKKLERVWRKVK